MMEADGLPPLSLYVHIPYCVRKCPYCDFHSTVAATLPEERYLRALFQEALWWRKKLAADSRPLLSIYIGGGTPSLFRSETIGALLNHLRGLWAWRPDIEISLEANPESASFPFLTGIRRAGVNRLSLGIQALSDERLRALSRPHDRSAALTAIAAARRAGFDNLNLDLIFGTPGHTPEQWQKELTEALALQPDHLSCYQLTLEPETPFFQQAETGRLLLPDEGLQLTLFEQTHAQLQQQGWLPYEISNFAREESLLCRHSLNYWGYGDYIGLGAAAHAKLTDPSGTVRRWVNWSDGERYMAAWLEENPPLRQDRSQLTPVEAANECLIMGLRPRRGLERKTYQQRMGEDIVRQRTDEIQEMVAEGWLEVTPTHLRLTAKGMALANAVMLRLM